MSYVALPQIAGKIAEWFPDLNGRAIAVTDDDIGAKTTPELPLAMVAPNQVGSTDANTRGNKGPELYDDFDIEFWFDPQRYKMNGASESPYYAFYDYIELLRQLYYHLKAWGIEVGTQFQFMSGTPSASEQAIILTYRFRQNFCLEEPDDMEPKPMEAFFIPKICEG